MSAVENGGTAFPATVMRRDKTGSFRPSPTPGMDLRDYIATQVLSGLCANPGGPVQASDASGWQLCNCTAETVADFAYGMADAMLHARGDRA